MKKLSLLMSHRNLFRLIAASFIVLLPALVYVPPVQADGPPSIPHQFYGNVYNNDVLVGANYTVVAKVGTTQVASATTDSQGRYGYSPLFRVTASSGALIEFYVNGVKAIQTANFSGGSITLLNIYVVNASSPTSATITSSILGQSSSFVLTGGVLQSAATLASANGYVSLGLAASTAVNMQGSTSLTIASQSSPPTAPSGSAVINAYTLTPANVTFSPTATLTLKYNTSSLPSGVAESSLYVATWNGSAWSEVASTLNMTSKTLTVQLSSFATAIGVLGRTSSTTTIAASILGAADSFVLTGGVLANAKTLNSSDSRVKLSFQANTTISMQGTQLGAATESNPSAGTDNSTLVRAYSFTPSGATFSPAAIMTLKYETPVPTGVNESELYIAWWNGSAWEKLTSTVSTSSKEVSASVSHFTVFSIRWAPVPATTTTTTTTTDTTTTTTTTTTDTSQTTQTTTATGTVSTNVMGSSGSFSVSSGAVASATTLNSADGRVSLSLAANTAVNLQGSQQLSVLQLASTPAPPANAKLIEAFACSPDNATFSPALTLTVKYNTASIPAGVNESDLYIALLQGTTWTPLASSVNTQNKTITAQINHFSTYAVLGNVSGSTTTQTTTSSLLLSDFTLAPEVAAPGATVTVSIRVANGGSAEATKNVVLKVNGMNEQQKDVTLSAGKSQVVTFTFNRSAPGSYTVSIDDHSGSLEIKAGSSDASTGFSMPVLAVIIAGGVLVILLMIVLIFRQRSGGY
ncbi:MAG: hypothetical protein PHO26_06800 [Dehalococcoidia bacterium]|nr:hypothetical protein [Dehalococcoidia bacterium]MDD5494377.1 hypothetical protein [Dehalococcoidia bacterium]